MCSVGIWKVLGICFNIFVLYFHVIDSHVNYNDYEGETVGDVWCWLSRVDLEEGALNNFIVVFVLCIFRDRKPAE